MFNHHWWRYLWRQNFFELTTVVVTRSDEQVSNSTSCVEAHVRDWPWRVKQRTELPRSVRALIALLISSNVTAGFKRSN
jgi:hypothetical protein